ncbi:MAG: hypothetical protein ACRD2J_06525 [Thermoanaerobaculia bacterium]
MDIERELRDALRRPEPPPGFEERVMARIARSQGRLAARPRIGYRAVAAATLLTLALGAWGGYRWEQRRRAERAAEQALVALQIVSEKMNLAKRHLVEPGMGSHQERRTR